MDNPSILDYLKSLFSKNRQEDFLEIILDDKSPELVECKKEDLQKPKYPQYWLLISLSLTLLAQYLLEPPHQPMVPAIILYILAIILLVNKLSIKGINPINVPQFSQEIIRKDRIKIFVISIFLLILSFVLFKDNRLNGFNLVAWLIGVGLLIFSCWERRQCVERNKDPDNLPLKILLTTAFLIAFIFRFYRLSDVPSEMFSDHAEKLLDVMDVLNGQLKIFFPRNTGREGFQFYLTALIIRLFNTGISFLSLKIGTALAGFITLVFIYLIGKELFSKWVGLFSVFFAGISYWHNVISRIGLRFPFYPLFVSCSLYYLIKGIKNSDKNSIIIAGLFSGLGLHGYSPFRIFPIFIVLFLVGLLLLEKRSYSRQFFIQSIILFSGFTAAIFLPLLRYMIEFPASYHYRAFSRLTSLEKAIDGPVLLIFIKNFIKSMTMFFYNNGVIWVTSIPNRPALEPISAVFFLIGILVLLKRVLCKKNTLELLILISVPVLMLPSIMSFAYPDENPALNRSSGALVSVFIISGLGFSFFFSQLLAGIGNKTLRKGIYSLAILLSILSIHNNFQLTFDNFAHQFEQNAWNTSEIGDLISRFVDKGYDPDNIFVIPYPHWVDTRLVGINAGLPERDFALLPEKIPDTLDITENKLFVLKLEDDNNLNAVELIYPTADTKVIHSKIPGKDFVLVNIQKN